MKINAVIAFVLVGAAAEIGSVRAAVPAMTTAAIEHYLARMPDNKCPDDPGSPPSASDIPITSPGSISVTSADSGEYIVQGQFACFCSVTGNCTFWVVESSGGTFRILLQGVGTGVTPLHSISHGHLDLEVAITESMTSAMAVTYQFDGQKYRETKCTYADSENGKNSPCQLRYLTE